MEKLKKRSLPQKIHLKPERPPILKGNLYLTQLTRAETILKKHFELRLKNKALK